MKQFFSDSEVIANNRRQNSFKSARIIVIQND